MHDEEFDHVADDRPSKSSLKRDAHARRELGDRLAELNNRALSRLPLTPDVRKAIADAQAIKAHGARRRQLQYLGKLLRREDADAIEAALDQLLNPTVVSRAPVVPIETVEPPWLERLLQGDDQTTEAFLADFPGAERSRLRQLLRNARQNQTEAAARGRKMLKEYLLEVIGAA